MTVSSTTNRKSYAGDGVTTSFSTSPVVFFDTTDLAVYAVVTATGVSTTLTENTHYTVTGGNGATGTINLAGGASPYGAPAAGYTLLIVRTLPVTQEVDLQNNDASDAAVQEEAFDRGVMIDQQLNTKISRSIRLADSDVSGMSLELPVATPDGFLKANAAGTAFEYVGVANVATSTVLLPVPITQGGTGSVTAATARTALGALGTGAVTTVSLTMATGKVLGRTTAATGAIEELAVTSPITLAAGVIGYTATAASALAGSIVQTKYTQSQAAVVGAGTAIPYDNTIPQITEGDLFLTAPAITPTNASNILRITVQFSGTQNTSTSTYLTVAVFQDSTANAVAASVKNANTLIPATDSTVYYMVAGTTSATTFTVRAGLDNANPVCMNGVGSATLMGGKLTSSITVEEIKV